MEKEINWAIAVAIAAPLIPIPNVNINRGSKNIFIIEPANCEAVLKAIAPSALTKFISETEGIWNRKDIINISVYSIAKGRIFSEAPKMLIFQAERIVIIVLIW